MTFLKHKRILFLAVFMLCVLSQSVFASYGVNYRTFDSIVTDKVGFSDALESVLYSEGTNDPRISQLRVVFLLHSKEYVPDISKYIEGYKNFGGRDRFEYYRGPLTTFEMTAYNGKMESFMVGGVTHLTGSPDINYAPETFGPFKSLSLGEMLKPWKPKPLTGEVSADFFTSVIQRLRNNSRIFDDCDVSYTTSAYKRDTSGQLEQSVTACKIVHVSTYSEAMKAMLKVVKPNIEKLLDARPTTGYNRKLKSGDGPFVGKDEHLGRSLFNILVKK